MYKFLRFMSGAAAIAVLSAVMLTGTVQSARAQGEAAKKWKDTNEYNMFNAAAQKVAANPTAAITDLDAWKAKYPASDYKDDGAVLYMQAYVAAKQPGKAIDESVDMVNRGVDTAFPDPKSGPQNAIKVLYFASLAIAQIPNPTPDQLATASKAAHALAEYNRKPEGTADAAWNQAREQLQPIAKTALLYIAMLPGNQAYDKKDWAGCEAAYTKALSEYPQNAFVAFRLGACMRSQVAEKPEKRSAAVYEFLRASTLDPTLGGRPRERLLVEVRGDETPLAVGGDSLERQAEHLLGRLPMRIERDRARVEAARRQYEGVGLVAGVRAGRGGLHGHHTIALATVRHDACADHEPAAGGLSAWRRISKRRMPGTDGGSVGISNTRRPSLASSSASAACGSLNPSIAGSAT